MIPVSSPVVKNDFTLSSWVSITSAMVSESILPMILWMASEITKPTLALLGTTRMERTADKTVS